VQPRVQPYDRGCSHIRSRVQPYEYSMSTTGGWGSRCDGDGDTGMGTRRGNLQLVPRGAQSQCDAERGPVATPGDSIAVRSLTWQLSSASASWMALFSIARPLPHNPKLLRPHAWRRPFLRMVNPLWYPFVTVGVGSGVVDVDV
jgi:hypothetical protein